MFNAADDTEITGAGVGSSRVTIADNVVTFNLINSLPTNTNVYVKIPASAFKDASNVFYTGILDKTTLNFSTLIAPSEANLINLTGDLNAVSTLSIYPNHAVREITIDLSGMGQEPSIRIASVNGTVKLSRENVKTSSLKVDVRDYAEGVYIVAGQSKSGHMVYKKFVIKK